GEHLPGDRLDLRVGPREGEGVRHRTSIGRRAAIPLSLRQRAGPADDVLQCQPDLASQPTVRHQPELYASANPAHPRTASDTIPEKPELHDGPLTDPLLGNPVECAVQSDRQAIRVAERGAAARPPRLARDLLLSAESDWKLCSRFFDVPDRP